MRNVLPVGIGDDALNEFLIQMLPPAILTVISGLDRSLESLAERANRVMDASTCHYIFAVSTTSESNSRLHVIENSILVLRQPCIQHEIVVHVTILDRFPFMCPLAIAST